MQTSPLGRHYPPLFLFCFLGKRCSALGIGTGTPVCSVKPMADIFSLCLTGMRNTTWAMGRLNSTPHESLCVLEDTTVVKARHKEDVGVKCALDFVSTSSTHVLLRPACRNNVLVPKSLVGRGMALFLASQDVVSCCVAYRSACVHLACVLSSVPLHPSPSAQPRHQMQGVHGDNMLPDAA